MSEPHRFNSENAREYHVEAWQSWRDRRLRELGVLEDV